MKNSRGPEYRPREAAADPEINEIERNEHTEGEQRSNRLGRLAFRLCAGPARQHQTEEGESGKPADNLPRFGKLHAEQEPNEERREGDQDEPRPRFDSGGDRYRYRFVPFHVNFRPASTR